MADIPVRRRSAAFNANSSCGCILALLQDDAILEAMEEYEQGPAEVQGLAPGQSGARRNRRNGCGLVCMLGLQQVHT